MLDHSTRNDAILFDVGNGVRLWDYYTAGTHAPRPALLDEDASPARIWFMEAYGGSPSRHPILSDRYQLVDRRPYGTKLALLLYERDQ